MWPESGNVPQLRIIWDLRVRVLVSISNECASNNNTPLFVTRIHKWLGLHSLKIAAATFVDGGERTGICNGLSQMFASRDPTRISALAFIINSDANDDWQAQKPQGTLIEWQNCHTFWCACCYWRCVQKRLSEICSNESFLGNIFWGFSIEWWRSGASLRSSFLQPGASSVWHLWSARSVIFALRRHPPHKPELYSSPPWWLDKVHCPLSINSNLQEMSWRCNSAKSKLNSYGRVVCCSGEC